MQTLVIFSLLLAVFANRLPGSHSVQIPIQVSRPASVDGYMPQNQFAQSGSGNTYYVDKNHQSSSDYNPGSESLPFKTIQKGVNVLAAGDTLYVKNGYYTPTIDQYKNLQIEKKGAASNYILIAAYPDHRPTIYVDTYNGVQLWNADYIEFRGFEVRGMDDPPSVNVNNPAHFGNGISVFGNIGNKFIRVIDNHIHHVGGNGIGVASSDQVLVLKNRIWHCTHRSDAGNSGISVIAPKDHVPSSSYGIVVAGNECFDNVNQFAFKYAGYITDGNGIIFDYYTNGDRTQYSKRTLAVNNIAHNNGGRCIHAYNYHDVDVVQNSCYGNLRTTSLAGFHGELSYAQAAGIRVYNNIVHATNAVYALTYLGGTPEGIANTNVFYNGQINANGNPVLNTITGNPQFIQASTSFFSINLRLQVSSSAIDAADSSLNPSIDIDFDGNTRPNGPAFDIGAFEFVAATPTIVPSPTRTATPTSSPSHSNSPTSTPSSSKQPPSPSPVASHSASPVPSQSSTVQSSSPIPTSTSTTTSSPSEAPSQSETPTSTPSSSKQPPSPSPTASHSASPVPSQSLVVQSSSPVPTSTSTTTSSPSKAPSPSSAHPSPSNSGGGNGGGTSPSDYMPFNKLSMKGDGNTYIVDKNKAGANDNNVGSEAAPFLTLPKGVSVLQPGDTLFVKNGDYSPYGSSTHNLHIQKTGLSDNWILIAAYPGHKPKINVNTNNGVQIFSSSYLQFQGFEISGVFGGSGNCIGAFGNPGNKFVRIVNNEIHDCGGNGIAVGNADQLLIANNRLWHNAHGLSYAGGSIAISSPQNQASGMNTAYGTVIAANVIYENVNANANGIFLNWFGSSYVKRALIVNNVVYGNDGRCVHTFKSSRADIMFNTCLNNVKATSLSSNFGEISAVSTGSDIRVYNNIIRGVSAVYGITYHWGSTGEAVNNLLYGSTSVNADGNYFAQNVVADPKFVNDGLSGSGLNLNLQTGSSAINAGNMSLGEQSIAVDIDGDARPTGGGYDLGAYETN